MAQTGHMRVLLTGALGKVGRATSEALLAAGHKVTGVDVARPTFDRPLPGQARYQQADLTDAGDAYALVRGHDAVVHAAAIPEPTQNPPHTVFHNSLMSTFNLLEAAVRWGVPRPVRGERDCPVGGQVA
jgi:UDP-glucose 4-epimerase